MQLRIYTHPIRCLTESKLVTVMSPVRDNSTEKTATTRSTSSQTLEGPISIVVRIEYAVTRSKSIDTVHSGRSEYDVKRPESDVDWKGKLGCVDSVHVSQDSKEDMVLHAS